MKIFAVGIPFWGLILSGWATWNEIPSSRAALAVFVFGIGMPLAGLFDRFLSVRDGHSARAIISPSGISDGNETIPWVSVRIVERRRYGVQVMGEANGGAEWKGFWLSPLAFDRWPDFVKGLQWYQDKYRFETNLFGPPAPSATA